MPFTPKGNKIMSSMVAQYGPKKAESVFYASRNAGKITGVDRPANPNKRNALLALARRRRVKPNEAY